MKSEIKNIKYYCPICGQPYPAIIEVKDGSFTIQRYNIYATAGKDNHKVAIIRGICENCY